MNSLPQVNIMELFKKCIDSELDLASFAEEFCFHYLYLDSGGFKNTCTSLFEASTDFIIYDSSAITPETIIAASEFFDLIRSTHQKLINLYNQ